MEESCYKPARGCILTKFHENTFVVSPLGVGRSLARMPEGNTTSLYFHCDGCPKQAWQFLRNDKIVA
jgi:hypothetical protein